MPRPCHWKHKTPIPDKCRICRLYMESPKWREHWGDDPSQDVQQDGSPGLLKQAASFATSVAKDAAGGFERVDEDVYLDRRFICNTCKYHDEKRDRCTKCGCPLEGKLFSKLRMATERCPINKW